MVNTKWITSIHVPIVSLNRYKKQWSESLNVGFKFFKNDTIVLGVLTYHRIKRYYVYHSVFEIRLFYKIYHVKKISATTDDYNCDYN